MENDKIKIKLGTQTFTVTLLDNNSAKAFTEMFPLTINMSELNNNEKYYDLASSLPTNSSNPGTIKNGDLMLCGSKTLVLFYTTFSTSYSYTKLGSVDDVTDLTSALGSGNVKVTFEK
ncbi:MULTISPECIES: cyclophilin-like fold protein [Sphingobacterium]